MSKVTVRMMSGKTLIFFDVAEIEKTTATVELSYQKKSGGNGMAIIPWSAIEVLYISEQYTPDKAQDKEKEAD